MKLFSSLALGCGLMLAPLSAAPSAAYPTRNIEIIVSYGPGGSTDLVARALAQKLQDRLGQPVVVVNRPGASGTLGVLSAMRAAPDGHTLYLGYTSETVVVPQISKSAKYSTDDFEAVAVTGLVPVVLIVSKNVRANTMKDFIDEMRQNPDKYTYGGSVGSPSHVMGSWMNRLQNLKARHVPYRGGAQSVNDVVGGHIDMFYAGVAPAKAAIDSGSVKALAVTGDVRSSVLPNVPTFKEAGVPEFELASWNVMLAPKGTPQAIIDLLRKETALALSDAKIREQLALHGVEPGGNLDVRAFLANEREKFGRAVRDLGIAGD